MRQLKSLFLFLSLFLSPSLSCIISPLDFEKYARKKSSFCIIFLLNSSLKSLKDASFFSKKEEEEKRPLNVFSLEMVVVFKSGNASWFTSHFSFIPGNSVLKRSQVYLFLLFIILKKSPGNLKPGNSQFEP